MRINKLDYVSQAENVITSLLQTNAQGKTCLRLTTSKIRNILSMVSELYNDAIHNKDNILSVDMQSRVQYLRMRVAYEAGREREVKDFVAKAQLLELIAEIGKEKENLILFCNYMEALVAYHRFYGGKEN